MLKSQKKAKKIGLSAADKQTMANVINQYI